MFQSYFATDIDGMEFRWHGGEYIEVGYVATARGAYEIDYGHAVGEFVAQDCINVWDYATGAPFIERSLPAFERHCIEYTTRERGGPNPDGSGAWL
jgi:hypothetical protein